VCDCGLFHLGHIGLACMDNAHTPTRRLHVVTVITATVTAFYPALERRDRNVKHLSIGRMSSRKSLRRDAPALTRDTGALEPVSLPGFEPLRLSCVSSEYAKNHFSTGARWQEPLCS
jgi:hypothetical protein